MREHITTAHDSYKSVVMCGGCLLRDREMPFSIEQCVFIAERYYKTKLYNSVCAAFANEYPEVGTLTNSVISRSITKFHETGSCADKWKEREPTVCITIFLHMCLQVTGK